MPPLSRKFHYIFTILSTKSVGPQFDPESFGQIGVWGIKLAVKASIKPADNFTTVASASVKWPWGGISGVFFQANQKVKPNSQPSFKLNIFSA